MIRRLLGGRAVTLALFFGACATPQQTLVQEGAQAVSPSEYASLVMGNTITDHDGNFDVFYREDGVKLAWSKKYGNVTRKWWVNDQGFHCETRIPDAEETICYEGSNIFKTGEHFTEFEDGQPVYRYSI